MDKYDPRKEYKLTGPLFIGTRNKKTGEYGDAMYELKFNARNAQWYWVLWLKHMWRRFGRS